MARECQDASRNLNVATKEAAGVASDSTQGRGLLESHLSGAASGGLSRESPPSGDSLQELPGVSFSGDEATTAASSSSTTEPITRQEGALGSSKTSPPPSSSSSDSETKDMEGDPSILGCVCQPKGKDLPESLGHERPVSAKRRLWDVNHEEVEESLKREIKRMRQEEAFIKSSKWNFDFEREVPLQGSWKWRKGEAPGFYKAKECSSAKKIPNRRFCPYERPATSRSLPSEVARLSSSLVTSAASSCSNATLTQPSTTETSPSVTGVKTSSAQDLAGGSIPSVRGGVLLKVPPATTPCLSATFSRPIDIVITTPSANLQPTSRATYVSAPSISRSRSIESSQENSNYRRGVTSETSAVSSSRFYPPPDDRRGVSAPSSSSATNRTCQSPNKKKMKASQSSSGSGSSDSGSSSSNSPSHLLKYYR